MIKVDSQTRHIGLFGNPCRHSLSPFIQNTFLDYYGINCIYTVFEPDSSNLKTAFYGAANLEFIGLNITMPFKEKVYYLVDKVEESSKIIKSVNTVKFVNKINENKNNEKTVESIGFSTDGLGFVKSLDDYNFNWKQKNCLMIGAGGAARSLSYEIIKKPIKSLLIFDINISKANLIKRIVKNYNPNINVKVLNKIIDAEKIYDDINLIINCTPLGMELKDSDNVKKIPIPNSWSLKNKYVFDLVYNPIDTMLLKKAKKEKAALSVSGIYMLVNQAAYSFYFWFNIMPQKEIIERVLKKIIKITKNKKICK